MKGFHLGEFEELTLLMIGVLHDGAYGVAIQDAILDQTGRSVKISAVHSVLHRMEKKGYVRSWMGGATKERGGRRKRFFEITAAGKAALLQRHAVRNRLWQLASYPRRGSVLGP